MRRLLLDLALFAALASLSFCALLPAAPVPARKPAPKPAPLTPKLIAGSYNIVYCGVPCRYHLFEDGQLWSYWPDSSSLWVGRWTLHGDAVTVSEGRSVDEWGRAPITWRFRLRRAKGGAVERGPYKSEPVSLPFARCVLWAAGEAP